MLNSNSQNFENCENEIFWQNLIFIFNFFSLQFSVFLKNSKFYKRVLQQYWSKDKWKLVLRRIWNGSFLMLKIWKVDFFFNSESDYNIPNLQRIGKSEIGNRKFQIFWSNEKILFHEFIEILYWNYFQQFERIAVIVISHLINKNMKSRKKIVFFSNFSPGNKSIHQKFFQIYYLSNDFEAKKNVFLISIKW